MEQEHLWRRNPFPSFCVVSMFLAWSLLIRSSFSEEVPQIHIQLLLLPVLFPNIPVSSLHPSILPPSNRSRFRVSVRLMCMFFSPQRSEGRADRRV